MTTPQADQDVVIHPSDHSSPSLVKTAEKELVEKYRSLKRRYHELEENHDESSTERLEERSVKRRQEQRWATSVDSRLLQLTRYLDSQLLDSITSLEKEYPGIQNSSATGSSLQSIPASVPQNPIDDNGAGNNEQTGSNLSSGKDTRTLRNGTQRKRGSLQGEIFVKFACASAAQLIERRVGRVPISSSLSMALPSSSQNQSQELLVPVAQKSAHDQNGQPGKKSAGGEGGETNVDTSRGPASGPSRSTRRSSRISGAEHEPAGDGVEPGPGPRTRRAAKRAATSPAGKTRQAAASATVVGKTVQTKSATPSDSAQLTPSSSTNQPAASSSIPNPPASNETPVPSDPNIDPSLVSSATNGTVQPSKELSPMESIVRVAEAAIAAQNAANNSQTVPITQSTSSSSHLLKTSQTTPSTPISSSSSAPTSYNPYMALVPGKLNTGPMPLSMNPYAVYYAPGTPITPGASPYSPYGNPYYYLTSPLAGPNGAFPSSPNAAQPNAQRSSPDPHRPAKPKRLKAHTVTSKSFSIPMVPRDKRGKPMLPLNVGIMTVISLGDVCMREHFHTERYIFPVGYEVTRRYLSTVDPNIEVVYHCTILDGGDGPKFQIVPSDVPDRPVIAGTATGAWSSIVKQANTIRNRQHSNSVSGPDFFGLGQNTIKHLIQQLPNADRLRDYVWQNFIEGGPLGGRHAAVIPALPEEYDSSLPIGAYYPTQSEREKRIREAGGIPETSNADDISSSSYYPRHVHLQAERLKQQNMQQMDTHPSQQPGEPSASGQQQMPPQTPGPSQIDTNLMNLQEFRAQLATSADRTQTLDGRGTGVSIQSGAGAAPLAATIASIMSAFPPASTPTPTQ
ncbi:hypothetical protein C0995_014222 [Termitomyces sp. Mi166|nr:hypothetical protein C0995_014222 [Termitomyces sp. Mi166\